MSEEFFWGRGGEGEKGRGEEGKGGGEGNLSRPSSKLEPLLKSKTHVAENHQRHTEVLHQQQDRSSKLFRNGCVLLVGSLLFEKSMMGGELSREGGEKGERKRKRGERESNQKDKESRESANASINHIQDIFHFVQRFSIITL